MGMGIGDCGLGIGDWAQSPIPNPQSPIPIFFYKFKILKNNFFEKDNYFIISYKKMKEEDYVDFSTVEGNNM